MAFLAPLFVNLFSFLNHSPITLLPFSSKLILCSFEASFCPIQGTLVTFASICECFSSELGQPWNIQEYSKLPTVHTMNPLETSHDLFCFITLLIEFCCWYCLSYSWDQHQLSWQLFSDGCNLFIWRRVGKLMARRRSSSSKMQKISVINTSQCQKHFCMQII